MEDPIVYDIKPVVVELEAGLHKWCSCGLAEGGYLCDGRHKGTKFKSVHFNLDSKKKVVLCQCKQTKNPPYCDGSHGKL